MAALTETWSALGAAGFLVVILCVAVAKLYADNRAKDVRIEAIFRENATTLANLASVQKDTAAALTTALGRLTDQMNIMSQIERILAARERQ